MFAQPSGAAKAGRYRAEFAPAGPGASADRIRCVPSVIHAPVDDAEITFLLPAVDGTPIVAAAPVRVVRIAAIASSDRAPGEWQARGRGREETLLAELAGRLAALLARRSFYICSDCSRRARRQRLDWQRFGPVALSSRWALGAADQDGGSAAAGGTMATAAATRHELSYWQGARYRPGQSRGHYASWFLRANHPTRRLAGSPCGSAAQRSRPANCAAAPAVLTAFDGRCRTETAGRRWTS